MKIKYIWTSQKKQNYIGNY